ncbi:MAG: hypothetical protein KBB83_05730 [Alphaproteobacteria bacterium]|nr:hypothetical protein [Alphaproteobacteria bacterium]
MKNTSLFLLSLYLSGTVFASQEDLGNEGNWSAIFTLENGFKVAHAPNGQYIRLGNIEDRSAGNIRFSPESITQDGVKPNGSGILLLHTSLESYRQEVAKIAPIVREKIINIEKKTPQNTGSSFSRERKVTNAEGDSVRVVMNDAGTYVKTKSHAAPDLRTRKNAQRTEEREQKWSEMQERMEQMQQQADSAFAHADAVFARMDKFFEDPTAVSPMFRTKKNAPEPRNDFKGNWTKTYKTIYGDVTHTPERVSAFNLSGGRGVSFKGNHINGRPIKEPLILTTDSTPEEFETALRESGLIK